MMDDEIRKLKERIRSRQLIPRLLPGLFPFDSSGKLRITTFFLGLFLWWWFIGFTNTQRCVVFETAAQNRLAAGSASRERIRVECARAVDGEGRRYTIAQILDNYLISPEAGDGG